MMMNGSPLKNILITWTEIDLGHLQPATRTASCQRDHTHTHTHIAWRRSLLRVSVTMVATEKKLFQNAKWNTKTHYLAVSNQVGKRLLHGTMEIALLYQVIRVAFVLHLNQHGHADSNVSVGVQVVKSILHLWLRGKTGDTPFFPFPHGSRHGNATASNVTPK